MEEVLEADYPALRRFLGKRRFSRLAEHYMAAYPSHDYTLDRLGSGLPKFIESLRDLPAPEFCLDLARVECALAEVLSEAPTQPVSLEQIASVAREDWEFARLRPIAALRLIACNYPVSEYLESLESGKPAKLSSKQKTWLAIHRSVFRVRRIELTRAAFVLFSALNSGETVGIVLTHSSLRDGPLTCRQRGAAGGAHQTLSGARSIWHSHRRHWSGLAPRIRGSSKS